MEANKLTEHIGNLIADNEIDQAISQMKALFAGSPKLNDVLLQSAKHHELLSDINRGTISYENSNLTKNQIRFALLGILNDIDSHAADPVIAEEISRFEFSGTGNVIQQKHSGTGDNIGRDKVVTTNYKMRVGILVVTIILATTAAVLFPFLVPKSAPLSGFVVSSAEKPVNGAKVVYSDEDGGLLESFTDVSGQFRFDDVNTKKIKGFSLTAFVEGRKVQLDTAGLENGLQVLQLRLPPGDPPFDVSYYDLKQESVTWLVNGTRTGYVRKTGSYNGVDDTWEKTFRGKPHVINNDLLKELKLIYEKYGEVWRAGLGENEVNIPFAEYYKSESDKNLSVWTPLINSDRWKIDGKSLPAATLKKIITGAPGLEGPDGYMNAIQYYNENKLNGASIYPKKEDLAGLADASQEQVYSSQLRFLSYVGRNHVPDDFLRLEIMSIVPDGCIADNSFLYYPKMYVQVAVVENNTTAGIEIDSFYLQSYGAMTLRSLEEDNAKLETTEPESVKLYPRHRLPAGEKLMIPLRIVFESFAAEYGQPKKPKQLWVYGPSYKIAKVDVGIERFAFRQKDPNSLLIYNGEDIGSCPYAFTYNPDMDTWQMEDHFLFNVNAPEKERRDTISLSQFDGRLQIRELDPETSHIDLVEVHHITDDGVITRYKTSHGELGQADGHYFTMNQGDEITLTFSDYKPVKGGRYFLVSKGYYEVYEQ